MANTCMTEYVFYGQKEPVEKFYTFLTELKEKCEKDGSTFNSHGRETTLHTLNYYFIHKALGIAEKDMIPGRGDIASIMELEKDGDNEMHFKVFVGDAWNPYPEIWENIFKWYFSSGIKIAYKAEESGCELFCIYDPEGKFFFDEYLIDGFLGEDSIWEYFETKEDCYEYCKKTMKRYCKDKGIVFNEELYPDFDKLGGFIDEQVNDNGTGDEFFYIHKFQYVT